MLNSIENKTNIFFTIILGILSGFVILNSSSLASENMIFILAIPLIYIFLLIITINLKFVPIILLFSRALLDPLLETTRINFFGEDIGIGGVLNFLIIVFAFFLIIRNPKILTQNKLGKPWIIFLLICLGAVIYSPIHGRAIRFFLNLVSYLCVILISFAFIKDANDKKFWIKILLYSSILPVSFANLDLLLGRGNLSPDAGMRIQGTFSHPNILAFYLVLIITLVFFILKSGQFSLSKAKINMLRIYMFNLFVLLAATKTRSAWISCWGLFFIYGLLKEKKYILYALFVPVMFLLSPSILERISDVGSGTEKRLDSFTWRLNVWKDSLTAIKQKFIFGYGLASFQHLSIWFFKSKQGVGAHNTYLEMLFETGVIGFAAYIAIYLSALKTFYLEMKKTITKLSLEYAIVFSYIISYMVVCFADNMLYYLAFNWYFWFFIGIMIKASTLDDEKDIRNYSLI